MSNIIIKKLDNYKEKVMSINEVQIQGGFSLEGKEFCVYGNRANRAKIYFSKNDTLLFKTYSDKYLLLNDKTKTLSNAYASNVVSAPLQIQHTSPKYRSPEHKNEKHEIRTEQKMD